MNCPLPTQGRDLVHALHSESLSRLIMEGGVDFSLKNGQTDSWEAAILRFPSNVEIR